MSLEMLRRLAVGHEPLDAGAQPPRTLTEKEIAFMRGSETEEERAAQHAAAKEAAQDEYRNSLHGRTETYRTDDPPTAKDLGVKVSGMSTGQERLVRFCAWRDQAKAEVQRLATARDHFFTAMGAPTVAQSALDALVQQDQSGFLAWVRAGATKATQYTVDAYRRAQLEERLSAATHEAEVARAGLAGIDSDLEFAQEVVRVLENRHGEFVRGVIMEAAAVRVAEYDAAIRQLQALTVGLAGASKVIADGRFSGRADPIDIRLPRFGSANAQLVVERNEIDRAARPWTDLQKRLMTDPRSTLSVSE